MLFTARQRVLFLIKATNQHGVHSPFVYNLVTKCIYNKTKYKEYHTILNYKKEDLKGTSIKAQKALFRLIKYFNPKSILELDQSCSLNDLTINTANPELQTMYLKDYKAFQNKKFDFMICNNILNISEPNRDLLDYAHNNSIIFVNTNLKSKAQKNAWLSIKENKKITVTIDFFYFKLLFVRIEQNKEEFLIRV